MSMLTGLLPPTGGSATLFGHDLVNELPAVRKLLGVCPQHDILWPTLSMQQHLHLVGALKGYTSEELERYVSDAVREVDLGEKFNSEVRFALAPPSFLFVFNSFVSSPMVVLHALFRQFSERWSKAPFVSGHGAVRRLQGGVPR